MHRLAVFLAGLLLALGAPALPAAPTGAPVVLISMSASEVNVGPFSLTLFGTQFQPGSQAFLGSQALQVTYVSERVLQVTGSAVPAQIGQQLAVSVVNPGSGGSTSRGIQLSVLPSKLVLSPTTAVVSQGGAQRFAATMSGYPVTPAWSVQGIPGGNATVGSIEANGTYHAPIRIPDPVTVRADFAGMHATALVQVQMVPDPGLGLGTGTLSAARLLEQATFGPTPAELARLKKMGAAAWIDDQLGKPETAITDPGLNNGALLLEQYIWRLAQAQDQLRQRVAYTLGQILVISMNKNAQPDEMVPYLQILSRNAFGNYRTLLGELAVSSPMGNYLDLANSNRPGPHSGANENFPRELMQLFTIGVNQLDSAGRPVTDAHGEPIPAYTQADVGQVALALTGWTFPGPGNNNPQNFTGPMVPREVNHEPGAKHFLNCSLPAGQGTVRDMDATLDCLFNHPNLPPFLSLRLIRSLVTSNPTPAFVQRIGAVFRDNGMGVRGDLRAVVRAILLDPEARADLPGTNTGRLREPILHVLGFIRALGGAVAPTNLLYLNLSQMAQEPLMAPSVFSFYSPLFRIPETDLAGPEFQIYTSTESVVRADMFWRLVSSPPGGVTLDLSPFVAQAYATGPLIDAVDQTLLYGRMPSTMRSALATVLAAQPDDVSRARLALYLTALSGQYAIQY